MLLGALVTFAARPPGVVRRGLVQSLRLGDTGTEPEQVYRKRKSEVNFLDNIYTSNDSGGGVCMKLLFNSMSSRLG